MKATGIVRKVDDLGRIVIPIELRRTMDIRIKEPLEFLTDGDNLIMRRYERGCLICGNLDDVELFKEKLICKACKDGVKEYVETI